MERANMIHVAGMAYALRRGVPGMERMLNTDAREVAMQNVAKQDEGRYATAALVACAIRDPEKVFVAGLLGCFLNFSGDDSLVDDWQKKILSMALQMDDWVSVDEGTGTQEAADDLTRLTPDEKIALCMKVADILQYAENAFEARTAVADGIADLVKGTLRDLMGFLPGELKLGKVAIPTGG